MSDLEKIKFLEEENLRLESELQRMLELTKKLELQRDGLYWEYEAIRYAMNEQNIDRTIRTHAESEGRLIR